MNWWQGVKKRWWGDEAPEYSTYEQNIIKRFEAAPRKVRRIVEKAKPDSFAAIESILVEHGL